MTMQWWTWWQGALALSAVCLGHAWLLRRPLGVSGAFTYLVNLRAELKAARAEAAAAEDPQAFEAALLAATLRAQGELAEPLPAQAFCIPEELQTNGRSPQAGGASSAAAAAPLRQGWTAHLTFALAMVVGGFIAHRLRGGPTLQWEVGPTFTQLFGTGTFALAALAAGGVLVGFGTRMSGGCTSGHGLSGVSRLQPGSLASTVAFFGTAVAVSFLLQRVLG